MSWKNQREIKVKTVQNCPESNLNHYENGTDEPKNGNFYVVGTPIGNLSDLTLRGLETLKTVDCIVCEDTRHTLKLLNHYGIRKPLISIFGPKEKREVPRILEMLSAHSVALVTDAGSPGISDPGSILIQAVRQQGYSVRLVPGVSAVSSAVSVSGLCSGGFVFLGFLHRRKGRLKAELRHAREQELPIVFFESPYRIVQTLGLALEALGENVVVWIGREMTKKFEEHLAGGIKEIIEKLKSREVLGEFTVILKTENQ